MHHQIYDFLFQSESVSDAIYNMDWTDLHKSTIKSLIIMMCRALRKIVFTCGFIVTLSLDSFKSVSFNIIPNK